MRFTLLILLALLCTASAEQDEPITPQRADAVFAWFDKLPLPGLQGPDLVRASSGWIFSGGELLPRTFLARLLEDRPDQFRVLTADGEESILKKNGKEQAEQGFVGFDKPHLIDEAQEYLPTLGVSEGTDSVRHHLFGFGWSYFDHDAQDLTLARWCAKLGDEDLAISILYAIRARPRGAGAGSLEVVLQKSFSSVLLGRTLLDFRKKSKRRLDLLESFQRIVALCPRADLSQEKAAIGILERMVREEAAHPMLTEEQLAALPPAQRAQELVFRLRDDCRENMEAMGIVSTIEERWPRDCATVSLRELGLAAAPALVQALDDDSFTREPKQRFRPNDITRVQDLALDILGLVAGRDFSSAGEASTKGFDEARAWWKAVNEKGEKCYLIERIAAGDEHSAEWTAQLLKKYPEEGVPFVVERARAETDSDRRVELFEALWKINDAHSVDFFAQQMVEGREIAERLAAAYGLRYLHDPRCYHAMSAEWGKVVAAHNHSEWPKLTTDPLRLDQPWSLLNFLATSNDPEAVLRLGEHAAALPVNWRANLILRLTANSNGDDDENAETPNNGTKKAIEDVLLDFLSDTAEAPANAIQWDHLVSDGRICDLAAIMLGKLWPDKYSFDPRLSLAGRNRQALLFSNLRAKELGEPERALPPESVKEPFDPDSERNVSKVEVDVAMAESQIGSRIAALRGHALTSDSVFAALLAYSADLEKKAPGIILQMTRNRDETGISINLRSVGGRTLALETDCETSYAFEIDANRLSRGGKSHQYSAGKSLELKWWQPLVGALETIGDAPPETPFAIRISFRAPGLQP